MGLSWDYILSRPQSLLPLFEVKSYLGETPIPQMCFNNNRSLKHPLQAQQQHFLFIKRRK